MSIPNPFTFLSNAAAGLGKSLPMPDWLVQEVQRRLVLLVNHVLQQEPQAMQRLAAQQGKSVFVSWRQFHAQVRITPAGLLNLDEAGASSDLLLEVSEPSVSKLLQGAVQGSRPPIRIAGDVDLASALNWVIDNVRWDLEDDLSRIVGDAAAHKLVQVGSRVAQELRKFAQGAMQGFDGLKDRAAGQAARWREGRDGRKSRDARDAGHTQTTDYARHTGADLDGHADGQA